MIAAHRHAAVLLLGSRAGPRARGLPWSGRNTCAPLPRPAPEFKEPLPDNFKSEDGWKPAQPSDAQLRGDWWTLFNDSATQYAGSADRSRQPDAERSGSKLSRCPRRRPLQSRV